MLVNKYYSLRTTLPPQGRMGPGVILVALTALTVVGLFIEIAAAR